MAKNHHSWGSARQIVSKSVSKTSGLDEVSAFDHMNAKVDDLYKKIDSLSITPPAPVPPTPVSFVTSAIIYCEMCRINGHTDKNCKMIVTRGST